MHLIDADEIFAPSGGSRPRQAHHAIIHEMTLEAQPASTPAAAGSQSMVSRCVEKIMQRSGVSEIEARRVLQHVLRQSMDGHSSLAPTSLVQAMGAQRATGALPVASDFGGTHVQRTPSSLASLGRMGDRALPDLPLLSSLLPQGLQQYHSPPTSPPVLRADQIRPPTQYSSPLITPKPPPPLGREMDSMTDKILSLGQESLVDQARAAAPGTPTRPARPQCPLPRMPTSDPLTSVPLAPRRRS